MRLPGDDRRRPWSLSGGLRGPEDGGAGYAAVDALVALLIISMSIVFSLRSIDQAMRVEALALEVRRAQTTLAFLLDNGPRTFDPSQGEAVHFDWRLETLATGAERPIEVCLRRASLEVRQTARAYEASTLETCPQREPS